MYRSKQYISEIVKKALHGYEGMEKDVVVLICNWIASI